jgi:hypothetical protein
MGSRAFSKGGASTGAANATNAKKPSRTKPLNASRFLSSCWAMLGGFRVATFVGTPKSGVSTATVMSDLR